MDNKYTIGEVITAEDNLYDSDIEWVITNYELLCDGRILYFVTKKNNKDIKYSFYENEIGGLVTQNPVIKNSTKPLNPKSRIKAMYAYTKLTKALIYLSSICQWGDAKHGPGPVREDVDYKAKQQAHFSRMMAGEKHDQESGIDHRIAIAFNCLAEIQVELKDVDVNDLVTKDLSYFTKEYNNG